MLTPVKAQAPVFELRAMKAPQMELNFSPGKLSDANTAQLIVKVRIEEGWYINADTVSDPFLFPSRLEAEGRGLQFGKPKYPTPLKKWVEALQLENLMFTDSFTISIPVQGVSTDYDSLTTNVILHYQACNNFICLAPTHVSASLSKDLLGVTPTQKKNTNFFSENNVIVLLVFAFLGGLLLNLMPCVLPVLSLKVLALVRQSGESRRRLLSLGFSMFLGVLVSFWILGGLVLSLRQAGVGWGFQFQNPHFVWAMCFLMFFFALNLFGVFEIWLPNKANTNLHQITRSQGLPGAFGHGILLTLLSTPCSAPFLGTAMGFAFVQPAPLLLLFFTIVGVGLASPYLLLSAIPGALRWVPKPGPWMLYFKQFMGFLLLATALWLLWILGKQGGAATQIVALFALLVSGLGAWLLGIFSVPGVSFFRVFMLWVMALGAPILLWSLYGSAALRNDISSRLNSQQGPDAGGWWTYSPELIADLQAQGKTIFLNFTADWCLTCKVNEKTVLNREDVQKRFAEFEIVPVQADWTNQDAEIGAALREFGRSGVPFYVIYPGSRPHEHEVLPELLTVDLVLEALERAGPSIK